MRPCSAAPAFAAPILLPRIQKLAHAGCTRSIRDALSSSAAAAVASSTGECYHWIQRQNPLTDDGAKTIPALTVSSLGPDGRLNDASFRYSGSSPIGKTFVLTRRSLTSGLKEEIVLRLCSPLYPPIQLTSFKTCRVLFRNVSSFRTENYYPIFHLFTPLVSFCISFSSCASLSRSLLPVHACVSVCLPSRPSVFIHLSVSLSLSAFRGDSISQCLSLSLYLCQYVCLSLSELSRQSRFGSFSWFVENLVKKRS